MEQTEEIQSGSLSFSNRERKAPSGPDVADVTHASGDKQPLEVSCCSLLFIAPSLTLIGFYNQLVQIGNRSAP